MGNQRQATQMETATDYAWAAGFVDGEGCVSLHLHTRRPGTKYPLVQLIVVQKDRRPLDHLQVIFGANETIGTTRRGPKHRTYYRLVFSGRRAAEVLTKLLPHLILKRDVAIVGLALQASIDEYSRRDRALGQITDVVWIYCRSLIAQAKWLNSGRWAAAETKSRDSENLASRRSDSPVCIDDKDAERGRNDHALRLVG